MTNAHRADAVWQNLRRLFWLRWIAVAGQLLAIGVAYYVLHMPLPLPALLLSVLALVVINVFTGWRVHQVRRWPVTETELTGQLLADVLGLSLLLFFAGGSNNPFVSLYLLPIAIAAATVRPARVWFLVGVASLCYSLLMVWFVPLPSVHYHGAGHQPDSWHVLGMWLGFMIAAVLMAWFVVRMAASLRERDQRLARAREEGLRREQVVALGALAAGAAHELGTPLSTIAVLARELEAACADSDLQEDLRLIQTQVAHCKAVLGRLSEAGSHPRADSGAVLSLNQVLENVADTARLLHPTLCLATQFQGQPTAVCHVAAFGQALLALLDNAAAVSPQSVQLQADWDAQTLRVQVLDQGPGLTEAVLAQAGEAFITTRPDSGLGIGLFLVHATLESLGGQLRFENRAEGGARVSLSLPLASLQVLP